MKRFWIKLYVELLDDPKMGPLPPWLKWRFVELLLVAAESDNGGTLPAVTQLAWRLRVKDDDLLNSLRALCDIGVVCEQGDRWKVVNFEKRQHSESYDRVKRFRERYRNDGRNEGVTENESSSTSSSDSSSGSVSESRGVGEGEVFKAFEANIGELTPIIADGIRADIDEYTAEWMLTAIEQAAKMQKRSLAYIEGTLKGWRKDGLANPRAGQKRPPRSVEDKIKSFIGAEP